MTILIVDDDPVTRRIMEMTLARRKHQTAAVANATEAFDWLKSEAGATLVITDIDMPGMSGLKFFTMLRSDPRWRNLPVIVCTVMNDEATVQDAIQRGVRHYLLKPVNPAVLTEKVEEILARAVPVLEGRFDAMARLQVSEAEYRYLVEDCMKHLDSLSELLQEARDKEDHIEAMLVARRMREPSELLGALRVSAAVASLEEATNAWQRDRAFGGVAQEVGILRESLAAIVRPGANGKRGSTSTSTAAPDPAAAAR